MHSFDLNDYDYHLPPELIAQRPLENRDESRLLVLDRKSGSIEHRKFLDLPEILSPNQRLVMNNTKVIRSRLMGNRPTGGAIEFFVLKRLDGLKFEGIMKSAAPQKAGLEFHVGEAKIKAKLVRGSIDSPHGTVEAEFEKDPIALEVGEIPLPPYIDRDEEKNDTTRYQTVYAQTPGSSAAPTAGLHFSERVFEKLSVRGVQRSEVTLHVGLATFRPIKTSDIRKHEMHSEEYWVTEGTAKELTDWKNAGKQMVAVGTTSLRTLESCWSSDLKKFQAGSGETSLFLYPGGRKVESVDSLITNFHLPKSTLLLLVSAFASRDLIFKAYEEAIREKYRFFSYGDAMIIL